MENPYVKNNPEKARPATPDRESERERERERAIDRERTSESDTYVCIYTYIYIYIYTERERERARARERERERAEEYDEKTLIFNFQSIFLLFSSGFPGNASLRSPARRRKQRKTIRKSSGASKSLIFQCKTSKTLKT